MSAANAYPATLTVQPDRIPLALREGRKHVAWRWALDDKGKPTKPPVNPDTGYPASTTGPSTWGTFTEALDRMRRDNLPGIGRVLTPMDDVAGIDLDHCVHPETGEIAPWAQEIIDAFMPTYAELSPSGTGIRIFVRGRLNGAGLKAGDIEVYDEKRFLTITGHPLPTAIDTIAERQGELTALYRPLRAEQGSATPSPMEFTADLDAEGAAILHRIRPHEEGTPRRAALTQRAWDLAHGDDAILKQTVKGDVAYAGESERRYALVCALYSLGLNDDEVKAAFRATVRWQRRVEAHGERDAERRLTTQDMPNAKGFITQQREEDAKKDREPIPLRPNRIDPETGEVLERRALTDYGNSERLVDLFGEDIRYVVEQQGWISWKGNRWETDDTGDVVRYAKETIRRTYGEATQEADSSRREAIGKHAIKSEAAARIEAMIKLASTEKSIPIHLADCDANKWALNVLNGTIDLRTGELHAHRREDLNTKLAPVRYDPDATLPLFDAFLARILPDEETRAFVQRAIGYSLTGDTGEETLFFPYGPAATGKSTLLAAVTAALGDYAATADFETFLTRDFSSGGPRNDVARLAGKRFIVSLEVDQGKRLAEGLVKSFTGGDVISARFLHKESFEFTPEGKLWLAANHRPTVDEGDEAMWRRIAQIPFDVQIPVDERDPSVKATLRNPEVAGPAILAWAVRGCLAWQRERLRIPKGVREATAAYRSEMDVLSTFLDDRCEIRKGAWVAAGALYGAYKQWCETVGERPESQTAFGRRLTDRGYYEGKQAGVRGRFGFTLSGQAQTRPFEEDDFSEV